MDFLENIWVKRIVSVICCLYGLFIGWIGYMSVFYKITYTNKPAFVLIYIAINLFFLGILIFARKQVFTSFLTMILMLLILPVILMNLGDWFLIIPPVLVIITIFFACGATETLKTVLGTIFILVYIVSGLGFFVVTKLFITNDSKDYTLLEQGVSTTEIYRYYIYDVDDNSGGRTEVYVEPNDKDKDFKIVKFVVNGYAQRKYNVRNHELPTVEWRDGDILYINNERYNINEFTWSFKLH